MSSHHGSTHTPSPDIHPVVVGDYCRSPIAVLRTLSSRAVDHRARRFVHATGFGFFEDSDKLSLAIRVIRNGC